ncbi:MAG: 4,5-DOPA dioxygenase extradiol [Flavobacteriales bacterium]|nr:4,5-DOPA dioxygenase extradiol [Flavobacteriales bacterium]
MTRNEFLKGGLAGLLMMTSLKDFAKKVSSMPAGPRMPVLFVGHGSPMNAIEDNEFSLRWSAMGKEIHPPVAILCISAHWYVRGTYVTAMDFPKTIHDFGGFPQALFEATYPAPGSPELAGDISNLITGTQVELDHEWGLDHGTWSVTKQMYPDAEIPVLQLSIDYSKPASWHYNLARELNILRDKGVLIIGSGNMVHNLRMLDWNMADRGFDWAIELNDKFKQDILSNNVAGLTNYESYGSAGKMAIPTPDHYLPLLYSMGLRTDKDEISFFNDKAVMGSITMTSVKFG